MKLFQQLLVAPAALGLLAPLSVSASEVNFEDISTYSNDNLEIDVNSFNQKSTNNLLAGGEGLVDSSDTIGGFLKQLQHLSVLIFLLVLKTAQHQRQQHLATKWVSV